VTHKITMQSAAIEVFFIHLPDIWSPKFWNFESCSRARCRSMRQKESTLSSSVALAFSFCGPSRER
jgi:hypothetical protein